MKRLLKVLIPLSQTFRKLSRRLGWLVYHKRYAVQQTNVKLKYCVYQYETSLKKSYLPSNIQYNEASVHNILLALNVLNGMLIEPGQTFSFWKSVGAPSRIHGYKKSMGLQHNKIIQAVGGGVNQLASLIYWMALHSPLTIMERHRHSFDLFPDAGRRVPFGTGVTCRYGIEDLQITNHTHMRYQIFIQYENNTLTGKIVTDDDPLYHYHVYEKEQLIKQNSDGEYIRYNRIHRKMYAQDKIEIADDFIMENNALMCYRPILARRNIEDVSTEKGDNTSEV